MKGIISLTGTESTGKTELLGQLVHHFRVPGVADVSRWYLEQQGSRYSREDVYAIAREIIRQEEEALQESEVVISDNDLINIKIWLEYEAWLVPEWLQRNIAQRIHPLYLLCRPDIPWVADSLRKNDHDREFLFERFVGELAAAGANVVIVEGRGPVRTEKAIAAISRFLQA